MSVLLLVVVVVAAAALVATRQPAEQPAVEAAPAPATAAPGVGLSAESETGTTPQGLTRALQAVLANPDLGRFTGRITDARSGDQLWAQGAGCIGTPASTNKMLTAAAALLTLDREARLTTRVLSASPGVVVLV
ncbi:D-alanyl-D-alanine carboxypeptidase, partial [Mycolicibacterium austroafricanum]